MFGIHDYWLFVATAIFLILTPGQDTFYILGRSISQGTHIGIASALGICTGTAVHTVAAAIGLSALLAASSTAFTILKLAGAAYLVYLGIRLLIAQEFATRSLPTTGAPDTISAYRQGVLTNVLNPKVALFFLALMPQFIAPGNGTRVVAFIALGVTFTVMGLVWSFVLVATAARLSAQLAPGGRANVIISRVAAGIFIFLGLRLAMSET